MPLKPGKIFHTIIALSFFLTLALPACAPWQQTSYKVGIVSPNASLEPIIQGFKDGMQDFGFEEGKNITFIYNGPVGEDDIESEINKMISEKADVILALGSTTALAAKKLTEASATPVVFTPVNDPVAVGLAESIRQPGGNMTGVMTKGYIGKGLGWLVNIDPTIRKVYVPYNPDDGNDVIAMQELQEAAKVIDLEIVPQEIRSVQEIPGIIENIPEDIHAIFLLNNVMILSNISRFTRLASERQIPLGTASQEQVGAGTLFAYGPRFYDLGLQSARLAYQVLKGSAPGSLPIEQADFYLALNQKTADNIGIVFSASVMKAAETITR